MNASSDLNEVVKDADVLIFASPHQYMHTISRRLMGKVRGGWGPAWQCCIRPWQRMRSLAMALCFVSPFPHKSFFVKGT